MAQPNDWVDADDWEDAPERTPAGGGGPQRGRKYVTSGERMYRDTMAAARGQAGARAGVLDLAVNSVVNAPADLLNAAANVLAAGVDPYASAVSRLFGGGNTNFQAQARANPAATMPLLTKEGGEVASQLGEFVPERVKQFLGENPLVGDVLTVGGGLLGARASGLLPKGPVLNEFSRNVARNRGTAPYQQSPVAEVAGRGYTVVPDDVRQSANIPKEGEITGYTRAGMGPAEVDTRIPMENIRKLTAEATADLPATERGLLGPNGQVDAGLLEGAINQATIPYRQVAQLPTPQVNTLAGRLRQAWQERGGTLKGDAVAEGRLQPLMAEGAPPMDSGAVLTLWKELNSYARGLRKQAGAGDAAAQIKSHDLQLIADAILDEIDDRAAAFANPQLTASLKQARTDLGRLHSLEDALDSTGWLDPTKLRAMQERGVPLSGGLAQAADLAGAAPRSFTPLGPAVNATRSRVDQFGREPPSYLRLQIGKLFGDRLARQGVENLNRELRAGTGVLRQPVPETPVPLLFGPNAGPEAPPLAPPTSLSPLQQFEAGGFDARPAPLEIQPQGLSQVSSPELPQGLSLEEPNISNLLAPRATLTDAELMGLQLEPGDFASIRRELGQNPLLGEGQPLAPGMQVPPRGINEAQLGGRSPRDFPLLPDDEPGPLGPLFGPDDEFPPPAAPVLPQGPAPGGAGGAAFAGELTLADTGPVAPRVDVTESLPSQGSALFADDFLLPGARRVESPTGFVDLLETPDGALQIKRTKTAPGQEGRGFGQERLLNAAREAQAQGKPLNSDVEVNPDARRLYEKLREKGLLEFDGPFDDGGPVFRNIRPTGGVSDSLGG